MPMNSLASKISSVYGILGCGLKGWESVSVVVIKCKAPIFYF
jgi:hypothetical protein